MNTLFAEGEFPEWAKYTLQVFLALCGGSLIPILNWWIRRGKIKSRQQLEEKKGDVELELEVEEADHNKLTIVVVELRRLLRESERTRNRDLERVQRDMFTMRADMQTAFNKIAIVEALERKCAEQAAADRVIIQNQKEKICEQAAEIEELRERIRQLEGGMDALNEQAKGDDSGS